MLHAIGNTLLQGRFLLVYAVVAFAAGLIRLAVRALPHQHPSRIYVCGRITEGRDRMKTALSPRE